MFTVYSQYIVLSKYLKKKRFFEARTRDYILKGVFYKSCRFWCCFLRRNCRETNDANEMRFSGCNMFIFIVLTGIFSIFYYSRFDPRSTLKAPLWKISYQTIDTIQLIHRLTRSFSKIYKFRKIVDI